MIARRAPLRGRKVIDMGVTERFLRYVKVNTASDPTVEGRIPSAEREFDLARMLADELRELGLEGVRCDD